MMLDKKKITIIIFSSLSLANFFAWFAVFDLSGSKFLEVDFFDVGQGDAAFIATPQGHQILIDGGPDASILEKLGKKMPSGDRTIDLIILSHPESDHMSGFLEVLKSYQVENILWTGIVRDTPEFDAWKDAIEKEGANIFLGKSGQKIFAGKIEIDILYPFEDISGKKFKDSNDTSLVVQLVFDKNSFLFTGDILKSGEGKILQANADIDSDVLKIGHHGSKTSTGEGFVSAVSPEFAVISVGRDNTYGHPHKITLDTLNKFGINKFDEANPHITILRTDEMGDIAIISDGKDLKIK